MKIKDYLPEKNEGVFILDYEKYENKTLYEISLEFIKKKADIFIFLKNQKVEYLLTHTDLIEIMLKHQENTKLEELKIKEPKEIISLKENDNVIDAYNLMRKKGIEHLIITDEENNFKGILTYKYLALFLTNIALKDELTKLYNRRFLDFILDKYENSDVEIGILFIDCDKFKEVNDTYGHKAGDEVLKKIADVIRNSIRDIDYPFRYGGDEFIVLIFTDYANLRKIASRISNQLQKENISVSIGISHYPTLVSSLKEAILNADKLMYEEKKKKD